MEKNDTKRNWITGIDEFISLAEEQNVDLTGLILDGSGKPEDEAALLRVANELDVYVPTEVLTFLMFGSELWYDVASFACAVAVYEHIDASKTTVEHVLKNVEWHAYNDCFCAKDVIIAQNKTELDKLFAGNFNADDIVWSDVTQRFDHDWHVLPVKLFEDNSGHEFNGVVIVKRFKGRKN